MTDEKKVHWTQTPKGREIMSNAARKAHRARKKAAKKKAKHTTQDTPQVIKKPSSENSNAANIPQDTFAYALGFIECWLETYAKSAGIPSEAFAAKLGKVLQHKNGR